MDRSKRCPWQRMEKGGQGVSCPASRGARCCTVPRLRGCALSPAEPSSAVQPTRALA